MLNRPSVGGGLTTNLKFCQEVSRVSMTFHAATGRRLSTDKLATLQAGQGAGFVFVVASATVGPCNAVDNGMLPQQLSLCKARYTAWSKSLSVKQGLLRLLLMFLLWFLTRSDHGHDEAHGQE